MQILNTMSGKKEELIPLNPPKINMYVCGPTVYNYIHLGNARPLVVFDTLRRYLKYRGYDVTYVQNFTDIDDKIIRRANEEGMEAMALAEKYIAEYFKDADAIGVMRADVHPRVSENIPEIIALVQKLIDNGYAYEMAGDVYYRVRKFKGYGKLSGRTLDDMQAGARIEVDDRKEDAFDFALWKAAKPGEPSWTSPWGEGRPGWHIECSVMSMKYLGKTIDIHGGGADLIFPHHENEIAQSEAATGQEFSRYWMHNGFITVNHEKMSKSLGNFFIMRDILAMFPGDVVRFYLISTSYRNQLDFDNTKLEEAQRALARLKNALKLAEDYAKGAEDTDLTPEAEALLSQMNDLKAQYEAAMDDDLNTANAIGALFEMARVLNSALTTAAADNAPLKAAAAKAAGIFRELGSVLGIFREDDGCDGKAAEVAEVLITLKNHPAMAESPEMQETLQKLADKLGITVTDSAVEGAESLKLDTLMDALIECRQNSRACKKYALADCLRDELKNKGIIVEDTKEGARWKTC